MDSMSIDSNFEDLLSLFIAHGVEFLVVGGYAFGSHATPRATKDLDLWINATPVNAGRACRALTEFGMPIGAITAKDLETPGPWLQFGRAPKRVDILTSVDGLDFADAWERRVLRGFGRVATPVLSIDDLILNKRKVGRPQDLLDVKNLERRRAEDGGAGAVSDRPPPKRRRRAVVAKPGRRRPASRKKR